jgi:hypothetical protein
MIRVSNAELDDATAVQLALNHALILSHRQGGVAPVTAADDGHVVPARGQRFHKIVPAHAALAAPRSEVLLHVKNFHEAFVLGRRRR